MRYRRLIPGAILVLAALAAPVAAGAAVSYRITVDPVEPRVGEPVTIVVATFAYIGPPAIPTDPLPFDDFPWTFVAESPRGHRHEIPMTPMGSSKHQWTAGFTFDEPGGWEVGLDPSQLATPVDPGLGARLTVNVRMPDGQLPFLLAVGATGLLAIGLGALIFRRSCARPT